MPLQFQSLFRITLLSLSLTACGFEQYFAKPIDQEKQIAAFYQKSPDDPAFLQFLQNQDYDISQLPLKAWDLEALIYCGLFFNPSLDEARAQLRLAQANANLAAIRPIPRLNTNAGRSDRANGDINPFTYTLSIDIPIETASKRNIRIENATHLSEIAQLSLAQSAWLVRQQIVTHYDAYLANQHLIAALTQEKAKREAIVEMIQKRVEVGLASTTELSLANLQLQNTLTGFNQQTQAHAVIEANLAASLGLSVDATQKINIQAPSLDDLVSQHIETASTLMNANPTMDDMQKTALIHRIDIRTALAQYAVAEGQVKLEIAKQYPDIVISPGYAYEFGDRVWSLGLSGLLTLIEKNKLPIASAKALRELEAAKFNSIQAKVINEVAIAKAAFQQAYQTLVNQQQAYITQRNNYALMDRKFTAGEIDRVELNYASLELLASQKNLALANITFQQSHHQLENTLQVALSESFKQTITESSPAS